MTAKKISALPAGDALDGSELVPVVQDGATVRSTVDEILSAGSATYAGAPVPGTPATAVVLAGAQTISGSKTVDTGGAVSKAFIGRNGADGRAGFSIMDNADIIRLTLNADPRGGQGHTLGGPVDFTIGPYVGVNPIGMAIEFHGIVECWTEDWSIHNSNKGGNPASKPRNAHLWVADSMDTGALLISASSQLDTNPRTRWCRFISTNADGSIGCGPMGFILRDPLDFFSWGTTTNSAFQDYAETITENARMTSLGQFAIGSEAVAKVVANGNVALDRFHMADLGGLGFRIQDSHATTGGATRLVQIGQTLSFLTYDQAAAFTGTPLAVKPTELAFWGTALMSAAGELLLGKEVFAGPGARLTVVAANVGQVAQQIWGRSGATLDILQVLDTIAGIHFRIDKAGYPMWRKAASPALGDMVNGEGALWVDAATGYARVTTRVSGALKQITLADDLARLGLAQTFTTPQRFQAAAVNETPLTSRGFAAQTAPLFNMENNNGVTLSRFDNAGLLSIRPFNGGAAPIAASAFLEAASTINPILVLRALAGQTADQTIWQDNTGAIQSRVGKGGRYHTRVNTAPADADLANGEMAFWFDPTNGAAKLMVKAKQTDGTVRTGELALV